MRGYVLEKSIVIEKFVSDFIEKFFFKGEEKGQVFRSYILNKEWFNFGKKFDLFIKILKRSSLIPSEEIESLRKNISKCGKIRNRFAHIHIFMSSESTTTVDFSVSEEGDVKESEGKTHKPDFLLEYLDDNGQNTRELINKEKFEEYMSLFFNTKEKIKKLIKKL